MKHNLSRRAAAIAIVVVFAVSGCSDKTKPAAVSTEVPVPQATGVVQTEVLGVAPAGASSDPAVGGVKTDMSRAQQSSAMPMPGQANDHSTPQPALVTKSAAKP